MYIDDERERANGDTDFIRRQLSKYFNGLVKIVYHLLLRVIFVIAAGFEGTDTGTYKAELVYNVRLPKKSEPYRACSIHEPTSPGHDP